MEPHEFLLTTRLNSMKKATVSCIKELLRDAKEYALKGELHCLLDLSHYILNMIKTIEEDVEEFLAKEGSNLWEESEKDSMASFCTVVKRCLATWVLMAIQLKMGYGAPGEA